MHPRLAVLALTLMPAVAFAADEVASGFDWHSFNRWVGKLLAVGIVAVLLVRTLRQRQMPK